MLFVKCSELAEVKSKRHEDNEKAIALSHELETIKSEIEESRSEHANRIKKAEDTYEILLAEVFYFRILYALIVIIIMIISKFSL